MVERFVGLDVSQRSTSICILDGQGARVWRGKCATYPAAIEEVIRLQGRRFGAGRSGNGTAGAVVGARAGAGGSSTTGRRTRTSRRDDENARCSERGPR